MDISSLLEVQVQEGKASDLENNAANSNDVVIRKNPPIRPISLEEKHFYTLMFGTDIASVRFRKLHCTACDIHIGSAPAMAHNMHEHPVLKVLLCLACRNFYGDGTFEQGDDATDMFCRWCANGGNLYCCSYCSNTFCCNCIKRNFDTFVRRKIEKDEKWRCFVCDPSDLYAARATCWALLQHIETVTRILRSDRKMNPKEIEAKMNLDESQCCLNRNRRKRSETLSDDEEQDETYNSSKKKRRRLFSTKKKRRSSTIKQEANTDHAYAEERENRPGSTPNNNDINKLSSEDTPLALRRKVRRNETSDSNAQDLSLNEDDIPAPLLECDQTMIEGAESLTFDGQESGSGLSEPPRGMGITTVPMISLMRRPVPGPLMRGGKARKIVRGLSGASILVRKIAPATNVQQLPMVTIPSINHLQPLRRENGMPYRSVPQVPANQKDSVNSNPPTIRAIRTRPLVPPRAKNSQKSVNVIDLDSDPEDSVIVTASNDSVSMVIPDIIPPDEGLLTIITPTPKEGDKIPEDEPASISTEENENRNEESLDTIDSVFDSMKTKLRALIESAIDFPSEKELSAAKTRTRIVNRTIRRTINELTTLSDDLLRNYRDYKRKRTKNRTKNVDMIVLDAGVKSSRFTDLDMVCTRDSEPEIEDDLSDEEENGETLNREIRPFSTKVSCGVEARPETRNQSVQVYDIKPSDIEKSIGYALLLKADYDPQRERDILRPTKVPDENFGKYEEQFINYLQHIEDHGIETEESKDLQPTCETISINDLVEADLSTIIKELRKSTGSKNISRDNIMDENVEIFEEHVEILTTKSITSEDSNLSEPAKIPDHEGGTKAKTTQDEKNDSSSNEKCVDGESRDDKTEDSNCLGSTDITDSSTINDNEKNSTSEIKQSITDEETVLAVRALIDEDPDLNKKISNPWKPLDSDDECTILD